jgi:hypothetical protein
MARKTNDKTVNVGAVNNCQHFGRWGYIEISEPWGVKINSLLRGRNT